MRIFDYTDFRRFIHDSLKLRSQSSRGQLTQLAKFMRVNTGFLSQILSGQREMSPDQAFRAGEFLGLSPSEQEFLIELVLLSRAGTESLRELFEKRIKVMKKKADPIERRMKKGSLPTSVPDEIHLKYYLSWLPSAVLNLTAIPEFQTIHTLSKKLMVSEKRISEALKLLNEANLIQLKDDRYTYKGSNFFESGKEVSTSFGNSWRIKGLAARDKKNPDDAFLTCALTFSKKDAPKIRETLMNTMKSVMEQCDQSTPESLYCLNLDWFEV